MITVIGMELLTSELDDQHDADEQHGKDSHSEEAGHKDDGHGEAAGHLSLIHISEPTRPY